MLNRLTLICLVAALSTPVISLGGQKNIVETAIAAGNFTTLVKAVKAAGLVDTLSGHDHFTVFAPTDAAFQKLDSHLLSSLLKRANRDKLTDVLTYHVVSGRVLAADAYELNSAKTVNGQRLSINFRGDRLIVGNAVIKVTDIECSNGVIHVIDEVLIPELNNIPEVANAAGTFETLLAAVDAADLTSALGGQGPFTVFAPTDEAFASLPKGTVESLLQPENKHQLIEVLKYHVVAGRVYANEAISARRAKTLLGRTVAANFSAKGLSINDAKVVSANIDTRNGVIHVIDSVLLPKKMSRRETMSYLNTTINRGVPVFNGGDHSACCEIYMASLKSIDSAGIADADDHAMSLIKDTMRSASRTHDITERAWVLRRGIDSLYTRLNQMPMSTQSLKQ